MLCLLRESICKLHVCHMSHAWTANVFSLCTSTHSAEISACRDCTPQADYQYICSDVWISCLCSYTVVCKRFGQRHQRFILHFLLSCPAILLPSCHHGPCCFASCAGVSAARMQWLLYTAQQHQTQHSCLVSLEPSKLQCLKELLCVMCMVC